MISRIVSLAVLALLPGAVLADHPSTWIGTWTNSPAGVTTATKIGPITIPAPTLVKGTLRYRLRISQGGERIRLRLSNEYGQTPFTVAAVSVGRAGDGLEALPGSLKKATFAREGTIVIPAGAPALTDAIDLPVKPLSDLVVSLYVSEAMLIALTDATSPIAPRMAADTDATLMEGWPTTSKGVAIRPIVSAVDVLTVRPRKVIVALGDSITDAGVDAATGERGWPGALSRRLQHRGVSVVNAGIGGNRLLQPAPIMGMPALSRLDQDVFCVPGLTHVVVLEGINDIGMSGPGGVFGDTPLVKPEELIAAYSQIVARAHERGVKVFGGTILPFEGAFYYSDEKEQVRAAVNAWIRTSKVFDGAIDFDAALRDPAHPTRLRVEYDPGDHLHPNPAGYRKMGEVIDVGLFDR